MRDDNVARVSMLSLAIAIRTGAFAILVLLLLGFLSHSSSAFVSRISIRRPDSIKSESYLFSTLPWISNPEHLAVQVAQKVQPAVVLVTPMGVRNMTARGSGFLVMVPNSDNNNSGFPYIVTAAHVAAPGYGINVTFFPSNNGDSSTNTITAAAAVVGRNQSLDLALLQVQGEDALMLANTVKALNISSTIPPVGTIAFAHGYPASRMQGPAMTSGIVCGIAKGLGIPDATNGLDKRMFGRDATTEDYFGKDDSTTFVVTDAAMAGGMSGGPLVDVNGTVMGINALIRPDLRALGNYAVSSIELLQFLKDMVSELESNNTTAANSVSESSLFRVVLFNDPMNKKERVSNILQSFANLTSDTANEVMMKAHRTGRGIVGIFSDYDSAVGLCTVLRAQDILVEVENIRK